jgi:hypothetical protein
LSVGSNEQTAVGQGHLISSKYNIGFVRHGDAGCSTTPHTACGFVTGSGNAVGDGFGLFGAEAAPKSPSQSRLAHRTPINAARAAKPDRLEKQSAHPRRLQDNARITAH